jgi:WD40 repeat protein
MYILKTSLMILVLCVGGLTAQTPLIVLQEGHKDIISAGAFSADGKLLASSSAKTVKVWDVGSGTELRTLRFESYSVYALAFSADGKMLAGGTNNGPIILWDVQTGKELRTLKGHAGAVQVVDFSSDGKQLASGGESKEQEQEVKIWDVASGEELKSINGKSLFGYAILSPDKKIQAIPSMKDEDRNIRLISTETGKEIRKLDVSPDTIVTPLCFSPDGGILASGDLDGKIKLWDVASGSSLRTLAAHSDWVNSLALSPDGKVLASGTGDGTSAVINLWDVSGSTGRRTLVGDVGGFKSVVFSADGKTIVGGNTNNTVQVWDAATGTQRLKLKDESAPAVMSADSTTLATGSGNLWDIKSGAKLRVLKDKNFNMLAFSPDGKVLASGSSDQMVKLWDAATGAELHTLKGHRFTILALAFSPDGKTLASGSYGGGNGEIELWDVATGRELLNLTPRASGLVYSLAFSPDGKMLASGSGIQGAEGSIHLWDAVTGKELRKLTGHTDLVRSLAFTHDGKLLMSGSNDRSIRTWETATGKELATLLAIDEREWLVVTPYGLFDGSPAAWSKIYWRFSPNLTDIAPVEYFFNEFYYPNLLADIFAGQRPQPAREIARKDRRQPKLELVVAGAAPASSERLRTIRINITEAGAGAQDVRLFRNGSLVRVWRGDVLKDQSSATLEAVVSLIAGENRFTAYAFNRDNIKSADASLSINGAESLRRAGTAYILAVGINRYANPQYNLKYAVADAQSFGDELKRQEEKLKSYERTSVISLNDQEATKANILRALSQLADKTQPEDFVMVYFAGHGTAQQQRFYLIPHDLGYAGERTQLDANGLQSILRHSISDEELESAFEKIDAGHFLLVVDACNSGQALEAEEKRRGPMNSKGLAQLAYEKGMYILTAAQSYQAAQEASRLGHGYLTYALVEEGLRQARADAEPQDGALFIREWFDFAARRVPQMQEEKMKESRGFGLDLSFVEGEEKIPDPAQRSIQRPRIFYRREMETQPFVIARP